MSSEASPATRRRPSSRAPVDRAERKSRAALRVIDPGNAGVCPVCVDPVKFIAARHLKQVIANVYGPCPSHAGPECSRCEGTGVAWLRVETFHEDCYRAKKKPYGEPKAGR